MEKISTDCRVYLSVDLDFWSAHQTPVACKRFFCKIWELRLPVRCTLRHHELLPHINASNCSVLVNVDYHSDLTDMEEPRGNVTEGTWGNYVSWRRRGVFLWYYPVSWCASMGVGFCHIDKNPFVESVSGWKTARMIRGVRHIPWRQVRAVGVSVSPEWLGDVSNICEPVTRLGLEKWVECRRTQTRCPTTWRLRRNEE